VRTLHLAFFLPTKITSPALQILFSLCHWFHFRVVFSLCCPRASILYRCGTTPFFGRHSVISRQSAVPRKWNIHSEVTSSPLFLNIVALVGNNMESSCDRLGVMLARLFSWSVVKS
jgi:hypothetical protein